MARTRKNRTMRHKKRGGQVDESLSSSSFSSEISPNNSGYGSDADSFNSSVVSNPLGGKRSRKHKRGGQWQQPMYPQQQQSSGWFGSSQPQQSNSWFGSSQGQYQGSYGKKPWYQFWGGKTKKHSRRRKHGGQAVTGFDGAWDQPATALAGGRRRRHRKH